jgi:hypothetical protein
MFDLLHPLPIQHTSVFASIAPLPQDLAVVFILHEL